MKTIYKYAKLPNNKTLINRINDASVILYKKLEDYDVNKNILFSTFINHTII